MSALTLVTGASGFIGGYAVRRLVGEGTPVRVLVRRPEALPLALRHAVDVCQGDIRDERAVDRAMGGVGTVLHLAACARAWSRDPGEFRAVNVEAVRHVLHAARREQVERLVHVSTILTLPPFRPAPVNGSSQRPTPYEESKVAGERLVESYAAEGRHAVIVHPTRVYGPGPLTDANAVTRVIALYLAGRLRVRLADGDVLGNYVHAADVAAGVVGAAGRGRSAAHYVLGGENVSFRGFLGLVSEIGRVRRLVLALPAWLGLAVARAAEGWGRLGGSVAITPGWVRSFLEDRRTDSEPAERDLGYAPRPLRRGIEETVDWLTARRVGVAA